MLPYRRFLLGALASLTLAACGGGAENGPGGGGSGGAGGSGGSTDGGSGGGGGQGTTTTTTGTGGTPTPDPIVAPSEQWTWIPFEDAFCANGATTGIGVNLTDKSNKLVIYMMGGGACWNALTCYSLDTAANIESGYGQEQFDKDAASLSGSLFDRNDPDNPTKDASYVFVPYCTGDIHAGDNPDAVYGDNPTMHVGFRNMTAYLKRITATFPKADRVVLSGSSAGGFGAAFNWWQTQQAFGETRVDLVDDSGPALPAPYLSASLEGQWRAAWNLNATLPEGCSECESSLSALYGFYAASFPKNRAALLSYTHDQVISAYFQISQDKVAEGLGVLSEELDGYANTRYYFVEGNDHVLLGDPANTKQNDVVLRDWLGQMLSDDPNWKSVKP